MDDTLFYSLSQLWGKLGLKSAAMLILQNRHPGANSPGMWVLLHTCGESLPEGNLRFHSLATSQLDF